jgi:methylated-DNA-[protein]-cysteine S-methyltransferase
MSANQNNIFKHRVDYSGLVIELVSDDYQLLEIDFVKGKKIKDSDRIPDPIKKGVLFLDDYFNGKKSKIEIILNTKMSGNQLTDKSNLLYLDMTGYTEKEVMVYNELLKVESGEKISYNELAVKSGIPRGARFAGNCMAGNRFPVIIPCHRVIKTDGSLGNYSGGVGIKELLLKHEQSASTK